MKNTLKAVFLVPRLDKASTRFRVLQYLPFLEQAGWDCSVKPLSRLARNWPALLGQLRKADVVVIQKKLFTAPELWLVRRTARRLIYDFDDAVMVKEGDRQENSHPRQLRRFVRTLRQVDRVIVGNRFLAGQARAYHACVAVVPTPVDIEHYLPVMAPAVRDDVVIGWIGSRGTLKYLKEIAPALERLAAACPEVRLKIVADDFFDLEQMPVIRKTWAQADEITDLQSFDIGVMPLTDDLWTRGKCGFKLLQCMATGLPVVCSPVGANAEIVADGREGFWAASEDAWVERLRVLVEDVALRRQMGERARCTVEQRYSLQVCAPRVDELLREVVRNVEPR